MKNTSNLNRQYPLKPFQEKVIANFCNIDSTVAIMPTGGGKSLIYWVATKAMKSTTLVISPLIALIDEQADKLNQEGSPFSDWQYFDNTKLEMKSSTALI